MKYKDDLNGLKYNDPTTDPQDLQLRIEKACKESYNQSHVRNLSI